MGNYTVINYEVKDRIATIQMNNPDVMNSLDEEMVRDIVGAMDEAKADENVKCIVLTGVDRSFCSGGDMGTLMSAELVEGADLIREEGVEMIRAFMKNPKPIIAAVNGYAVGAGLSLCLICDYVIAKDTAKMGAAFSKIGLIPDTACLYLLPKYVGLHKAKEIVFSAKNYLAQEMLDMGIGNKVVPADEFDAAVQEQAEFLAGCAGLAIGFAKTNMHKEMDMDIDTSLELDALAQAILMQTPDKEEGIDAFMEKRPPNFK